VNLKKVRRTAAKMFRFVD